LGTGRGMRWGVSGCGLWPGRGVVCGLWDDRGRAGWSGGDGGWRRAGRWGIVEAPGLSGSSGWWLLARALRTQGCPVGDGGSRWAEPGQTVGVVAVGECSADGVGRPGCPLALVVGGWSA
jgi:hypothetical protein